MMKIIFPVILSSCLLLSCGPDSGDATSYNDTIITEQNKVANKGEAFYAAMDISPEEMQKAFLAFCSQVDTSTVLTKQLGPFNGTTEFLDAALKSLQMYKFLCDNEYKSIVEILSKPEDDISDEDTERYHATIKEIEAKLAPVLNGLDASQLKFATNWNFTIDATKTFE